MTHPQWPGASRRLRHRALRELIYTARFAIVGAAATLLHLTVVWVLIERAGLPALSANAIAFLSAFGLSFAGNYYWTFGQPGSPTTAIQRFFLVSSSAFALNTLVLAALISTHWLAPSSAAVLAACLIPVATFLASRLWALCPPRESVEESQCESPAPAGAQATQDPCDPEGALHLPSTASARATPDAQ